MKTTDKTHITITTTQLNQVTGGASFGRGSWAGPVGLAVGGTLAYVADGALRRSQQQKACFTSGAGVTQEQCAQIVKKQGY